MMNRENPKRWDQPHDDKYQTPPEICAYMASLLQGESLQVLEPTAGAGNLVHALTERGHIVTAPDNFEELDPWLQFDAVVMNPPFLKNIESKFLHDALSRSKQVVALVPWFCLINSDTRAAAYFNYGIKSVTHLPRNAFPKIRVQTCILNFVKGHTAPTVFNFFGKLKRYKQYTKVINRTLTLQDQISGAGQRIAQPDDLSIQLDTY